MTFRAALVQMRSGTEPAANVRRLADAVREAADRGVGYVQTPEMTGSVDRDRDAMLGRACLQQHDPLVHAASELARDHRLWLHVGSTPLRVEGSDRLANRSLLFRPDGSLHAVYDKLHMFDVDLADGESWRESDLYVAGNEAVACGTGPELDDARLGLTICYDLRFPELYRTLAAAGADMLAVPAAFTAQTGRAHWRTLLRARAIECGAVVLAAAQGGVHEDGRRTWGRSMAVDPWGVVIGELPDDEPGLLVVDVDLAAVREARRMIPNLRHHRPFSVRRPVADLAAAE